MATLAAQMKQLRAEFHARRLLTATNPMLERLRVDAARIFIEAGHTPDPWQSRVLHSISRRILLLCARQCGKSLTAAALSLRTALLQPGSLVLLLSPSMRQSGELFRDKVLPLFNALNRPIKVTQESALQMTLANGSRIVSLPGEEETLRGYSSVKLLVIDEASRVSDSLYRSVRPMLAVSGGTLVALSTPFGRRGWFYDTWNGADDWLKVKVAANQCPRIAAEFLAEEERTLGPRWFAQEYLCSFEDVVGSIFSADALESMISSSVAAVPFPGRSK